MTKAHYHHMDSLRAVMMVLGVVLHAAQVFNPSGAWLLTNPETSFVYSYLAETIHKFRIPVFFIVSGFFTLFVLLRKGSEYFVFSKLKRIGVPILTTALTLNLLQSIFLDHWNGRPFSVHDFLLVGSVGHLWFLINLLIYFVSIYLLGPVFIKYCNTMTKTLDSISSRLSTPLILFLLPLGNIAILATNKVGFPLYWSLGEIISMSSLLDYFTYFLFGIAIYLSPVLADRIQTIRLAPLAILIAVLYGLLGSSLFSGDDSMALGVLGRYFLSLQIWAMSIFVYVGFYKFLSTPSPFLRAISESSYTVYLVHHCLVIYMGAFVAGISLNLHLKFLLVFLSAYAGSYIFHRYIVARRNLASYLFNGRTLTAPALVLAIDSK